MMKFAVFGGSYLYAIVDCDFEQLGSLLERGFSVKAVHVLSFEEFLDESEEILNG